jgi:hypothetical protein
MSTVTTDAVDSGLIPDARNAGQVLCRSARYEATAALDANSVIQMVPVCDGMLILDIQVSITAQGSGRTIDVGDGADVDRFFDGVDVSFAAAMDLYNEGDVATCFGHEYTGDDTIDVKILGGTLVIDSVVIMNVYYKMLDAISDEDVAF